MQSKKIATKTTSTTKSTAKQNVSCSEFGSVVLETVKNPLREFLKKQKKNSVKTMEALNQRTSSQQEQKISKAQNNPLRSFQTEQRKEQNTQGQKISDEEKETFSMSEYLKKTADHIFEGGSSLKGQQKEKKPKFSNIKVNMHEFLTIKQSNFKDFYQLLQIIGQGAFGQVFRAKCLQTQQYRAVKIIKRRMMNQGKIKQFLAETSLLKKISHPAIVKVYDLYRYQNNFYVVMEYCKGGALSEHIQKIKFKSEKITSSIIRQLLGALNYLHSLSIIHRDIKIDNIVFLNSVTEQNIKDSIPIKIIDFGTAHKMKYKIQHKQNIAGTFTYMAPQVLKGTLCDKLDIWSTGVTMIRLLTGVNPFSGSDQKEVIKNISTKYLNFKQKPFNLVSEQARDLLSKMLERNIHKRSSARELLSHPWFGIKTSQLSHQIQYKNLQFSQKNYLVQVIECYLTINKVNQQQRQKMAQMFNQIDTDCSGHIQPKQFKQLYNRVSPDTPQIQLDSIIDQMDKDKSGNIDFNQFLVAMSNKHKLFIQQSLSQAFDHFDKDKTGYLEKNQIKQMLKDCPNHQIEYLIQILDKDQDNKISKKQFIDYLIKQ